MVNNLAEQQVNNNNKAKTKQQTQEQPSLSLSQVLKIYDSVILRIVSYRGELSDLVLLQ